MKTLYTTPNKDYQIVSFSYDGWKDFFGDLEGVYIFKTIQPEKDASPEEKEKDETAGKIFRQEKTVRDCLAWLRRNDIISKDELTRQLSILCP